MWLEIPVLILGIITCLLGVKVSIMQARLYKMQQDLEYVKGAVVLNELEKWVDNKDKPRSEQIATIERNLNEFLEHLSKENDK